MTLEFEMEKQLNPKPPTFSLRLSHSQQMALADVVAHYMTLADQPQQFINVVNDETTQAGDLLRLILEVKGE